MVRRIRLTGQEARKLRKAKQLGGRVIKVSRVGSFGVKIGKIPRRKSSKPLVVNIQAGNLNSIIKARRTIARRKTR